MTEQEEAALTEKVEKEIPNASVVEVVDVEIVDANGNSVSSDYFDDNDTLTVAFTRDDTTKKVVKVLYWNDETKAWDEADFEFGPNGEIIVTFKHLCTVAFVLEDVKAAPNPPAGDTKPGDNKKPGTSPQTGYNTALWVAAAVVLILGAGYCFVSARKKAAE